MDDFNIPSSHPRRASECSKDLRRYHVDAASMLPTTHVTLPLFKAPSHMRNDPSPPMYVAAIFSRIREYVVGLLSSVLFSERWLPIFPETTGREQCSPRKHLAQNITCSNPIKFRMIIQTSEVDFHFSQATQWLRNGFVLLFMVGAFRCHPTRQKSSACRRCFIFSPTVCLSPPITHRVEPHLVVVVQIQLTDWDELAVLIEIALPSVSVSD